jgi:hypothetical protein
LDIGYKLTMTINNPQKEQNTINGLIFVVLITIGSMILIEIFAPNVNNYIHNPTISHTTILDHPDSPE